MTVQDVLDPTGRVVLVTGAAGPGLGAACCRLFAEAGDRVVVADRSARRADEAAASLEQVHPGRVRALRLDVSDPSDVRAGVDQVLETWGRVDVLVNNAAVTHRTPIPDTTVESWKQVIDVCLTGPFLMMRACLPAMYAQASGVVVNVASVQAWTGRDESISSYVAAKAGLLGLTRAAAAEAGPLGVRVNAVAPGLMVNPGITSAFGEEFIDAVISETPMRRTGTPDDCANAVLYLASDASSFITGDVLTVSGGYYMHA